MSIDTRLTHTSQNLLSRKVSILPLMAPFYFTQLMIVPIQNDASKYITLAVLAVLYYNMKALKPNYTMA